MATDLAIRAELDTMRYLPLPLARLVRSMSSTFMGGQVRYSLPEEMLPTPDDREYLSSRLAQITTIITASNLTPIECSKARLSLLTKMLLASPVPGNSADETAEARSDMYDDAIEDIPPWALRAAIRRWNRGEVPDLKMGALNFNFAPAPAVLRAICNLELADFKRQQAEIEKLLACVTTEQAMDRNLAPVTASGSLAPVLKPM
jgi:hypothetical protein